MTAPEFTINGEPVTEEALRDYLVQREAQHRAGDWVGDPLPDPIQAGQPAGTSQDASTGSSASPMTDASTGRDEDAWNKLADEWGSEYELVWSPEHGYQARRPGSHNTFSDPDPAGLDLTLRAHSGAGLSGS